MGNIYDTYGRKVGSVNAWNGNVYDVGGTKVGSVNTLTGAVYDDRGEKVGSASGHGDIHDAWGYKVGEVAFFGSAVRDASGREVGKADIAGAPVPPADMTLRAGAALLLLLREPPMKSGRSVDELLEEMTQHWVSKGRENRSLYGKVERGVLADPGRTYAEGLIDACRDIQQYVRSTCPISGGYDEPNKVRRLHDVVNAWYEEAKSLEPSCGPYDKHSGGRFKGAYYRCKQDAYAKITCYTSSDGHNRSDLELSGTASYLYELRSSIMKTVVPGASTSKKSFSLRTTTGPTYKVTAVQIPDGRVRVDIYQRSADPIKSLIIGDDKVELLSPEGQVVNSISTPLWLVLGFEGVR
jgi:hypothetical protein